MTFSRPKHSRTDAPTEDLREFMAVTSVHLFILEQYLVVKDICIINSCKMGEKLLFSAVGTMGGSRIGPAATETHHPVWVTSNGLKGLSSLRGGYEMQK